MAIKQVYIEKNEDFIKSASEFILTEALFNVEKKGSFTLVLTGGSTPMKIYEKLAEDEYKKVFPWQNTYFFLGDERILSTDSLDCNTFMIKKALLDKINIPDKNIIFPQIESQKASEIALNYEKEISNFFGRQKPIFDLMLLGMGIDGHTASMFPNERIWRTSKDFVLSTSTPAGNPCVYRVTMGLELINNSKKVLMLTSGKEKMTMAQKILAEIESGKRESNSPICEIDNNYFVWYLN